MFGLDDQIAHLGGGASLGVVLLVAVALGLRHATDPDHLAAVSTLIASDPADGTVRAGRLGLAWGAGHAVTLALLGLPVVLFNSYLPGIVQTGAEVAVGCVIMALALRLLWRWRNGQFHAHAHRHGQLEHRHLHRHDGGPAHAHAHDAGGLLGRSPEQAFGIGLIHGAGGSAGVGVLLLASVPNHGTAAAALLVLAVGTAISMAMLSSIFGYALSRGPVARRVLALAPGLGLVSLAFGAWYALSALEAVPYPL
jgi:ABC-type nickel/cobalt efflux system permease component RcnA